MQPSGHEALPDGAAPGEAIPPPASDRISPAPTGGSCPPPSIPDHQLFHLIGRGSYGQVWLARNRLGTPRAVKIVSREAFEDRKPFEREFKGIQRFEPVSRAHEGLVDILQVGGTEDYFYYVMELADDAGSQRSEVRSQESERGPCGGPPVVSDPHLLAPDSYSPRTLRVAQQQSGGRLPVRDCVRIGRLLASALAHLHRHNLVHRDVKPSNVIFVEGLPKLADIGLVADVSEARSFVGTEGFIPPEGPGTPRADLYSLGKVLYEISTGLDRREFPALPAEFGVETAERSEVGGQRSAVSGQKAGGGLSAFLELNAVITKACQADPAQRYASAEAMETDLAFLEQGRSVRRKRSRERRWAVARVVTLVVLALAAVGLGFRQLNRALRTGATTTDRVSIFVLPFRHSAPIAERPVEYEAEQTLCLCGRLTDAFIDTLTLIPGIRTGPRKSGWIRYDEDQVRRDIIRTNDTRFLLTGRVDHTNDLLRVRLRLYARAADAPRWDQTFEGTTNDVIGLEHAAIEHIAHFLGQSLDGDTRRHVAQVLSNNVAAYRWLLAGRAHHLTSTKVAYRKALECFDRALELDRNYVFAHVAHMRLQREYSSARPPAEVWPRVADRANQILAIDDTCFVAQYRLANKLLAYDYDWERGIQAHDRLVATWPDYNLSWAVYYRTLGRTNDARVYHERLKQEPEIDYYELQHLAFGESVWGNHEEALRLARQPIGLPSDPAAISQYNLGHCLLWAGRYREAIDAFLQAFQLWEDAESYGLLGRAYALVGDRTNALGMLRRLEERESADEADPYYLAWVHAALGAPDRALEYLHKAIDYRSEYIISSDFGGLRTDPAWNDLRDDPRFEELCRRVGMGQDQWPK